MSINLFFILKKTLINLGIRINNNELKFQLLSNPTYPSLHAITSALDYFNIQYSALELPKKIEIIDQLPEIFMATSTNRYGNDFFMAKKIGANIKLIYSNNKKEIVYPENFLTIWSGVIVAIDKDDTKFKLKKTRQKTILNLINIAAVVSVIGMFFLIKVSLLQSCYFFLSIVGIYISLLIFKHEGEFQSNVLDKFCSAHKSMSCDAVLNSRGATIFNYFKLSDISFIYFVASSLTCLFFNLLFIDYTLIKLLSLTSIPITIYSIFHQYKIVKKWCPLCLGIVTVLWLQCGVLFFENGFLQSSEFSPLGSFTLLFCFMITASLWIYIKPLIKKTQAFEQLKIEHYKLKKNFQIFSSIYDKGKTISFPLFQGIVLGNHSAKLNILIITNPLCLYCKETHEDIEKLLNKFSEEVKVTICFNVSSEDKNSIIYKVVNRLLKIHDSEPERITRKALNEVYEKNADLDKWLLKWGKIDAEYNDYNTTIELQHQWYKKNNIDYTPAIYLNDKPFPKHYRVNEISFFIEDLISQIKLEKTSDDFVPCN
ncbi:vitamin K epoxide reductase family protein [Flavivirga jejuensis]|uniref:Vitamin K epoxide reductase family protein n=1 Tax=Flavivirga jejuensis TaxID=870487 RepID=A0ABT8WKI3_9FLAO|nr:vitamin K epoxide reductase family protein [Flavivirga jejuensis]MDO5973494.1 vitamin K epoxide reductase family protein [Flavivirga jejuensis]